MKVRFLHGSLGLYSRPSAWHEMAKRTDRERFVCTWFGREWTYWWQCAIFYLRCFEDHSAALRTDFYNFLYPKLLPAGA